MGRSIGFEDGKTALAYPDKIVVPFASPDVYELTEHELSHLVFQSDAHMREEFVKAYVGTLEQAFAAQSLPFDKTQAHCAIAALVGILDDARVLSLWSVRYPGSAERIRTLWRSAVPANIVGRLEVDVGALLYVRALGLGLGEELALTPAADDAVARVQGRGFPVVLVAAREYLKAAVSLLGKLEESATDGERLVAAKSVLGTMDTSVLPAEDVQPTKDRPSAEINEAAETAQEVLRADIEAVDVVDGAEDGGLAKADADVRKTLGRMEAAVLQVKTENEYIRETANERIAFVRAPQEGAPPMSAEDLHTVDHLRSMFIREMGRRREALDEYGTAPDMNAWLQRRLTQGDAPVFRGHEVARGFNALVLLDLSQSMRDERKFVSAERACRIIAKALKFPFVDFSVWGFSADEGLVHITRFSPLEERFDRENVYGTTPTHVVVRAARTQLKPKTGNKHIFLVTDGRPCFQPKLGEVQSLELIPVVRAEVDTARRAGIQVASLIIDARQGKVSFPTEAVAAMLGDSRTWRRAYADEFAGALIDLVSSAFLRHLRSHA